MSNEQFRPSRFQILPPVVKNLLIINALMYLATIVFKSSFNMDLGDYLGLYPIGSVAFRPFQLVTHLFMHGSFMHILSNMFALWMFGNVLENYWGSKRFFIYYIVTGLGAAAIHTAYTYWGIMNVQHAIDAFNAAPSPDSLALFAKEYVQGPNQDIFNQLAAEWSDQINNPQFVEAAQNLMTQFIELKQSIPTVGASGAVFGVLLAFGMTFPNSELRIFVFLMALIAIGYLVPSLGSYIGPLTWIIVISSFIFPGSNNPILYTVGVRAKYFVAIYGGFELYALFQNSPGDNIAHFAHLGGMIFGYILIRIWQRNSFSN